jgi:hypothetical protein
LKIRERFAHWRSKLRHYKEKIISLLEVPVQGTTWRFDLFFRRDEAEVGWLEHERK